MYDIAVRNRLPQMKRGRSSSESLEKWKNWKQEDVVCKGFCHKFQLRNSFAFVFKVGKNFIIPSKFKNLCLEVL
jgi:hypothetical protein